MKKILHYIYDPLCGWCYAAQPLLHAVLAAPWRSAFQFEMHAGGLFQRMTLPQAKRDMIRDADRRIGQMTGQVFGDAYLQGLLANPATIYDSLPPIAAILAVQAASPEAGPAMLQAIQYAHYREGLPVVQQDTLAGLAQGLGVDRATFASRYNEAMANRVQDHLDQTLILMHQAGAQGFPAFVLQDGDRLQRVGHEPYYADPAGFANLVEAAR